MNEQDLNDRAIFYSKLVWDADFKLNVRINNRLKSTEGRYISFKANPQNNYIEIAKHIIQCDKYYVFDVLMHELTHWYLESIGKDNSDHSTTFENELKRIGITSTGTTFKREQGITYITNLYVYECPKCKLKMQLDSYHSDNRYKCWRCNETIGYIGNTEMESFSFKPSRQLIDYEIAYLLKRVN